MRLTTAISSVLFAASAFGITSLASAATCNSSITPAIKAAGTFAGTNCGNNLNYSGSAALCGGVAFSTTGTDVWQVTLGAAQNFTFSVTSAAFTPDIALLKGSCADNAPCVNSTDYNSGGATATSTTVTAQTAGTYYLVVTDSTAVGAQCGAYNLTVVGTLPVKLQNFSVQ